MSEHSSSAPSVIILAGGFGTRVSHLLPGLPKPMAPVAGRPFVEWVVRYLARFGCTDFVLSTGYLAEVMADYFAPQPVPGVHIRCCPETTPLGTAGGCINALPLEEVPDRAWLVVNGDSLVFADPTPLWTALSTGDTAAGLLGLALPDAGRYGSLEIGPQNELVAFREKKPGAGVINAGVYLFREKVLRNLPSMRPLSFELDVFPPLADSGHHVHVCTVEAPFLDIGTPATLAEAENFILRHQSYFL